MKLRVIVPPAAAGGYWAEVPALGCVSPRETMDGLLANVPEAIEAWLSVDDIPAADSSVGIIELAL